MRPSSNRAMHAALSGWLVGMLAVGPAAAQSSLPLRLTPRAVPTASPSSVTVVAISLDATSRTEAARLAYWAEQSVARSGRLDLVRLSDALDAQGKAAREAKAAEGASAMKDGQTAYDELDTQKALQQFEAAARAFEASDLSRNFGDLSRARVMKAASQVANGEGTAAQLEIRAVLAVDPRAQFSPNFFPPDDMAFVDKERKAALAGSTATLSVRTEPVPAQVYVDGQFRGVSPVDLKGLTPADHYVTVMAPGFEVEQRRAREGETTLTLAPAASMRALQTLTERIVRKPEGPERDLALRELGTLAGVSQVLALLVRGGTGTAPLQVTGLRLDVADGHNLAYALGPVPAGETMATGSDALLSSLVGADTARLAGNKPVTHFASGGGSNRKTLGYVLMATGVALLAGGIYFGMEASSKEDDFRRAPQTSPRAQDFKDTGKTYALVADIGLLTGAVAAGLGGYFAFSGGGSGGGDSKPTPAPAPAPKRSRATPPPKSDSKSDSLSMPPPPKGTRPVGESLPMPPPPPPAKTTPAAPPAKTTPVAPAAKTTPVAPAAKTTPPPPVSEPPPPPTTRSQDTRRSKDDEAAQREEELRKRREEVERQRRELEDRRKQEEESEAKRKREEEEKRKREEDEKKKRPSIDEDDLRNY
ncbi:PEGA domain-containing protein [Myxococcus sp. CA051A]|uniref:PEGA domain-containing protein n=1 Tax=unclassified Myxococcus TaxID=2648731 RepID=UPI00157B1915|nr:MULTISPECIES: PEGA domain-containing protein [unclassified Myxococcus]NTX12666.1 PEGA domain-containing protein [Myxococcus sp. CA056]NTX59208.1 PEGA domain-containing protein [Myxococcus sp. CA051A]